MARCPRRIWVVEDGVQPLRSLGEERQVEAFALGDQLRRASTSIPLNLAEGTGKFDKDARRFYAIARGSALECADIIDSFKVLGFLNGVAYDQASDLARPHRGHAHCHDSRLTFAPIRPRPRPRQRLSFAFATAFAQEPIQGLGPSLSGRTESRVADRRQSLSRSLFRRR